MRRFPHDSKKSKTRGSLFRRRCKLLVVLLLLFILALIYTVLNANASSLFDDEPEITKPAAVRNSNKTAPSDRTLYFDENLTRFGERYISLEDFFDCLDARLNVDHRTKTERAFTNANVTIPYLVLPVTVEQGDMKALMCNLTVQIRHLMYVQNGGVGSMTAFLDHVQAAFAFTSRLKLPRMPQNYGYSVALNVAMRDALSLPFDEVPFLMMANNDVRIPGGMLEAGLPQMYVHSLAGRARVAELEAEVATEPNEYTPVRFRDVPLRSTDGRHLLVTSRLLPDRIRYQSKAERRTAFADYYGALHPDASDQTAFWGLSRLAMEVTGYFDENCYPAYYEDTDYLRRMWLLGFMSLRIKGFEGTPLRHIGGGSILAVKNFQPAAKFRDVPPFIRGSKYVLNRQYAAGYTYTKYGLKGGGWPDRGMKEPYPHERLPLDVYVLNVNHNLVLTELQRLSILFHSIPNPQLTLNVRTPLELLEQRNASLVPALDSYLWNSTEIYHNGNSLRLLSYVL
ncbi:beta galactofuranosyl glycosyle transferase [Lotmaria passim]